MTKKLFIANPNATNSELDAKVIIKPSKIRSLTSEQRDQLIEQFVEIQVDNMDVKTMMQYITWSLKEDYANLSDDEIQLEVETYDEDLYEELVDNVTQQYPKQLNSFGN